MSASQKQGDVHANVQRWTAKNGLRIYRIRHQPYPYLSGYVYLILGEGFPPTMFDAGSGEGTSFDDIMKGIEQVRKKWGEKIKPQQIEHIILSHAHIDHFGGTHLFKELGNPKIYAHPYDAPIVETYRERTTIGTFAHANFLHTCGVPEEEIEPVLKAFGYLPERTKPVHVDDVLEDGDKLNDLEILHFPGHSAGHLGMRVGEFLLTGDLILSQTLTQNWPATFFPFCGFARTVESMKKLYRLTERKDPPKILLPGHEDPIYEIQNRIQMVHKSEDRRNTRLQRLLTETEEGMTINELAQMMFWTAHINRRFFALADVAARLEYLMLCGSVSAVNYEVLFPGETALRWRLAK